jgi:hypothetical protein
MDKLFKVYAVVAKYAYSEKSKSFFDYLFKHILRIKDEPQTFEMTMAVFSQRKEAEKYIKEGNYPYAGEEIKIRIDDWKVDYELYWKEWNKLEDKK